jgi:phage antirepressor YoqD-like protein
MRLNGYLMENNKPYQHYIEAGLFKLKEALIEKPNTSFIAFTTMVTPKGQKYFYDKLKGVTNDTN